MKLVPIAFIALVTLVTSRVYAATIDVVTCDDLATAVAATATEDTTANFIDDQIFCGIATDDDDDEDVRTLTIENNVLTFESSSLVSYRDIELVDVRFVLASSGELLVKRDAKFAKWTGNRVTEDGGWMHVEEGSKARFLGDLDVSDYDIVSVTDLGDFSSDDLDGGCLWNEGYFRVENYTTFSGCDNIGGGESSPGNGGAVFNGETGSILFNGGVTMEESNLGDNEGGRGAGIYNLGKVNIKGSSMFLDLAVDDRAGGAIYNGEGAKFTFRNKASAIFSQNAANDGSAVFNLGEFRFSGPALFSLNSRTIISNNSPGYMKLSSESSFWTSSTGLTYPAVTSSLGAELDFPDDLQFVALQETSDTCAFIYVETEDGFDCFS